MRVLGIESSCDETAASVVDGRTVLSSVVASQYELHEEYGGVVPEIASRAHAERILPVIVRAASEAGVGLDEIDAIAVGNRPGLIGPLLVGVSAAKALSWSLGVPLIGVDHVRAHLFAALLVDRGKPIEPLTSLETPALGLVVSGGHSSIYRMDSSTELVRLGGTIDDALGEAFDKVAAMLELGHPGGPEVETLAREGDFKAHRFPVSRLKGRPLDFSFSGLKTSVLYAVRGTPGPGGVFPGSVADLNAEQKADVAASFQHAAIKAVLDRLGNAVETETEQGRRPKSLIAGGGVVANTPLRDALSQFCNDHGLTLHVPRLAWCVDNAAMVAGLGGALLAQGEASGMSLRAMPTSGV